MTTTQTPTLLEEFTAYTDPNLPIWERMQAAEDFLCALSPAIFEALLEDDGQVPLPLH